MTLSSGNTEAETGFPLKLDDDATSCPSDRSIGIGDSIHSPLSVIVENKNICATNNIRVFRILEICSKTSKEEKNLNHP